MAGAALTPPSAARKGAWCPAGRTVRPHDKNSPKEGEGGRRGGGTEQLLPVLTLMACPKKPFPRTSPWIRSHGRKICWE